MKSIVKNTLILVAITLVAGLALAMVYEVTKEPIAAAEKKAQDDAYRMVMPEADSFSVVDQTVPMENLNGVTVNECRSATDADGNFLGYILNVTSANGYGGDITLAVGVEADLTITGISVISQSETAGLGAKCTNADFTDQFKGIAGFVGFGKTDLPESNQINAISGATITTKAVTEAVNTAISYVDYLNAVQEGGNR